MKIAVTYEEGQVFQHFGHSKQFKIYTVENGAVQDGAVVDTNGSGHSALAGFLVGRGVEALICGGIGMGARNALAEAGIRLYAGVTGPADEAAAALAAGTLQSVDAATCDHHHEGGEHACHGHQGDHACGGHCGHHK